MPTRTTQSLARRLVFSICAVAVCAAQASPAHADESDTQQWTLFTVQKELSSRWRSYFEVQPRFGKDLTGVERLLVRPAIGYRLNNKVSVWQGYGWTPLFLPEFQDEHRLFQQLLYEDKHGDTSITSRTRFEERFIEGAGDTAFRFRTMLRLAHPISADKKWSVVGYDELFVNLNSTPNGPESGFDQNRTFLGVSRQMNPELRIETGYLFDYVNSPRNPSNRKLNVWVVQFAWNLK